MRKLRLQLPTPLAAALILLACASRAAGQTSAPPSAASAEYLSDHPEILLSTTQAWGELGLNTAAHASGQTGEPLRIGQKTYSLGLGHHASGTITILLDGQFAAFDAEVGLLSWVEDWCEVL